MNIPEELKYTKDHAWVRVDENTAIIGITDFAQGELGDTLKAGEIYGSVEAVKTVSDLYLPVSGKIIEFNQSLEDEPELINTEPYGKGWIIKLQIEEGVDLSGLLTDKQYQEVIG